MKELTENDINLVHCELEKKFPSMLKGVQNEGMIQAAIERQNRSLYGSGEQYTDVFKKAASLMEAITRWHIFNDGNKRTGLLCAFFYLYLNEIYLAIPIDAVRFTQKIAATEGTEQEEIKILVEEISSSLIIGKSVYFKALTVKFTGLLVLYFCNLAVLNFFGFKKYIKQKLDYWFATEAHPEYKKETSQVYSFMKKLMVETSLLHNTPRTVQNSSTRTKYSHRKS